MVPLSDNAGVTVGVHRDAMAQLVVTFDPSGLQAFHRAAEALASPDKLDRAIHEGIRQAGDKMRTVVRATLTVQMGLKSKTPVVQGTRSYIPERFAYAIEGNKKGQYIAAYQGVKASVTIPMARFSARQHWRFQTRQAGGKFGKIPDKLNPKTGGVVASPWGVAHAFKRSFEDENGVFRSWIAEGLGSKGGKQWWRRRRLDGPGTWKEIVQGATVATFDAQAPALMEEYAGRRLARLLP